MLSRASDRSSSLGTRFLESASSRAQIVAVFFEERTLTYGELARQSLAFASALRH